MGAWVRGGAAVARYVQWAQQEVQRPQGRGMRVESLEAGRPEMCQTLDRAEKFLNLVALLSALLSAVAVALAARGFASRHLKARECETQYLPGGPLPRMGAAHPG